MSRRRVFLLLLPLCAVGLAYACSPFGSDDTSTGADAGGALEAGVASPEGGSDAGSSSDAPTDGDAAAGDDATVKLDGSVVRPYRYIWIVQLASRAEMTGIDAADTRCMANLPANKGVKKAKALLVGSSRTACTSGGCGTGAAEHKDWPLFASTEYRRVDGTVVGQTNPVGIFPNGVTNSVGTVDGVYAWTGLKTDNTWLTGETCSSWASALATDHGVAAYTGPTYTTGNQPFAGFQWECNQAGAIYCVETDP